MTEAMEEHAGSSPPSPSLSTDDIADDVEHELDPAYVDFEKTVCWVITISVSFVNLGAAIVAVMLAPRWAGAIALVGWIAITLLLVRMSLRWPLLSHRHSSYRVNARGIEIREGVWWRQVTDVPRSRIQHTDVSQGPMERRFGLATLTIHTAGAENSQVVVHGLSHPIAMRIRDHLLTGGEDDGV